MSKPAFLEFKREQSLSDEGMAALLTDRLGEEVTAERVSSIKKIPRAWLEALDIAPAEFRRGDSSPPEGSEKAPKAPEGLAASAPPVDEFDWYNAKQAIEAIYVTIGEGVAKIRGKPHIAQAFKAGAPVLADDWIALARVDARTRAVIGKLMVVGPGGKLAMDHIILIGKILSLESDGSLPRPEAIVAVAGDGAGDGSVRPVAAA